MKYLIRKYELPDHWYPRDQQKRAKIEEYLNWHGTGIRMGAAGYIFNKVIYFGIEKTLFLALYFFHSFSSQG